jgi:GTP-binding protein
VVDASVERPEAAYEVVRREMKLFDEALMSRPEVVAFNKIDVPDVAAALPDLQRSIERYGVVVYPVSALSGEGVSALMDEVVRMVQEARRQGSAAVVSEGEEEQVPLVRPRSLRRAARVEKRDGVFVVDAPAAERIAVMIDLDDWTARSQFNVELRRMGVTKALDRAGAQSGDRVRLGDAEWELE